MNKSIMFLGMLAVSFANAQQGNVGINTDQPKATLEIQPSATNLAGTTNEGIVAPKLTKERIASIAVPVEGTLVYATDAVYAGADVKVAKIDEKGYYFFDGTEWVKTSNEWVYKSTDNRIYLKRSGDTNGTFKNSVFYNADTGQYVDIDNENNIRGVRLVNNNRNIGFEETTETLSKDIKYKNYIHSESKNLHASIARSAEGTESTYKQLEHQSLIATEDDATDRMYLSSQSITIPPKNANNFKAVYGNSSNTHLFGTGEIEASLGQSSQVIIGNSQSVKGYITGILGNSAVATSGKIEQVYGIYGRSFFYSPVGANIYKAAAGRFLMTMPNNDNSLIKQFAGIMSEARNSSQNTGEGTYMAGIYSAAEQQGKIKYRNMYGIYTSSNIVNNSTAPDNNYGLYITHIRGGAKTNYAIYTGLGKVHLGDEVELKSTIKVASSTDDTCDNIKAGTIRFKDKKFQGCTGTEWKDLHN